MRCTGRRGPALLGLALTLLGAPGAGARVVISQVYGGGGNTGAKFRHDFIELYNTGPDPVNLAGWSVRYLSANATFPASVTPANTTPLTGVIAPGRYYLIQEDAGSGGSWELPPPDAVGSLGLSAGNGKIALVRHSAPLPANTRPPDAALVDFVGYGTASAWEGSGPAPAPDADTAIRRLGSPRGATDTDDNARDFAPGPPDPRNSAFNGAPAVRAVSATPGAVSQGAAVLLVAEISPGFSPVQSVTANLSPAGGGSAAPMTYNPSSGAYQLLVSLPSGAPPGIHLVTVTATDTDGRTGSAAGPLTVNGGPPLTVRGARNTPLGATLTVRGIVTATRAGNPVIQDADGAADPGGLALSDGSSRDGISPLLAGQEVEATGRLDLLLGERTLMVSGPSAIVVRAEGRALPQAAPLTVADLADPAWQGRLVRLTGLTVVTAPGAISAPPRGEVTSLVAEDSDGRPVRVALHRNATAGAATPYPGSAAQPLPAVVAVDGSIAFPNVLEGDVYTVTGVLGTWPGDGAPVVRVRDASDLVRTLPRLIVAAGFSPALVEQGGTTTLAVSTNPPSGVVVTADLRALGGAQTQPLAWDGAAWSLTLAVPSDAPLGGATVPVQAVSSGGGAEERPRLSVISPLFDGVTISQLRAAPDGTQARTTGVVTARTTGPAGTYSIQDATGGIRIVTSGPDPGYNVGDRLAVTGVRDTAQGGAALDATPAPSGVGAFSLTGFGQPVPAPVNTNLAGWAANAGRLARTSSLVVLGTVNATGGDAYLVTDGTAIGEMFLADRAGFTAAELPATGAALNVTGIVDTFVSGARDTVQIRPRFPVDVTAGTPPAKVPVALAFATQPAGGWPGQRLVAQPVVVARAADGKTVDAFAGPVEVSLLSGTGAERAALSGARTVSAAAGVAGFTDLSINKAGAGYVLVARSGGLLVQSAPFSVGAPVVHGDVDGDGSATLTDARLTLRVCAGLSAGFSLSGADVDGDGSVTLRDAAAIGRMAP